MLSALVAVALAAPVTPTDLVPEPVRADVQLISGGMFSPDHIGPDRYQQVIDRVHADPFLYLDALQPPSNVDQLRDSTPEALLRLTEEALPGATRDAADRWLAADALAYDRATDGEIRRRLASQAQALSPVGAAITGSRRARGATALAVEVTARNDGPHDCRVVAWEVWGAQRVRVDLPEPLEAPRGKSLQTKFLKSGDDVPLAILPVADCAQ